MSVAVSIVPTNGQSRVSHAAVGDRDLIASIDTTLAVHHSGGVLTVRVPKAARAQRRRIEVQSP